MTNKVIKLEPPVTRSQDVGLDGVRVHAAVSTGECRDCLSAAVAGLAGVEILFAEDGAASATVSNDAADVFLFEADNEDVAAALVARLRSESAGAYLHIGVLLRAPSRTATLRLLREGADDVLSNRPNELDIARCLAHATAARDEAAMSSANSDVRTIAFVHASGGAGATTMSVNSAVQLKQRLGANGGNVCILDFDLQYGDIDLHLDLSERSRLDDILNTPERLDHRMLESLMIDGPLGIRALTAPESPVPFDILSKETVESIISVARRHYRYVIIDMPLALANWTDAALRKADRICLVTQLNVTSLRAARRFLDILREEGAAQAPITVIANRHNARFNGAGISLSQAEKALEREIACTAPNEYPLLVETLNQGVPVSIVKPGAKYCESVSGLLDRIADHKADGGKVAKRSFLGLRR